MTLPRIEERTFYEPIVKYLNESGFQAIGNTKILDKEPDVLFTYGSLKFVIEVKIGKADRIGVKAVAQAFDYGRRLGTQNIIIVIYPEEMRNETIFDYGRISGIALETKAKVISLTDVWTEDLDTCLKSFFIQLKEKIEQSKTKFDFATIVKLIERYVSDLNSVVYQIKTDELVSEVVNKLDLFASIGDIKDLETAKRQVLNLASFLFFNQLLFYYIYTKKARASNLPELEEIKEINDIKFYFSKITEIDYQAIYKVNLINHLPNKKDVIGVINDILKAIKLLRAEHITHDLAGRFFHDLIPFEVRKVLAAFYTHPNAADLLANLAIDKWDETVMDPACGSGTLLVASYNRKRELYEKLYGFTKTKEMHKKFIENDLTGIDLMPFAAHISAINLTMQNIEEQTNTLRIATMDSLELAEILKSSSFRKGGIKLSPYTTQIQRTLEEVEFARVKRIKGSVSAEGRGSEFYLKPVDVVIMNPPFSDREKLPKEMRDKINKNELSRICGNQVNLWGYFLALSYLLLAPNGVLASVIPINIARGKATEKIRQFMLEKFTIKYIIKTTEDNAFSEGASFQDILFIAEKRKPNIHDRVNIVFLKKSLKDIKENSKLQNLANDLSIYRDKKVDMITNDNFQLWQLNISTLRENIDNLMLFLRGNDIIARRELLDFLNILKGKGEKLRNISADEMLEGFHASPKGLSELVFITYPRGDINPKNSIMILNKESEDSIEVKIEPTNEVISLSKTLLEPALKTITGVRAIDITLLHDYIVKRPFNKFDKILAISKWKGKFSWELVTKKLENRECFVAIQHRVRMNSPNTHLVAVYGDKPFFTTHAFNIFKVDKKTAKILALFFNSILGLIQLSNLSKETTGGYLEFMQSDLINMKVPNLQKLNKDELQILTNFFEKFRNLELPSLIEQLGKTPFKERVELDSLFLKILGFPDNEIQQWLPKLYKILMDDIKEKKTVST